MVGIIKPTAFSLFYKGNIKSKKIVFTLSIVAFVFLILSGLTAGTSFNKISNRTQPQVNQQKNQSEISPQESPKQESPKQEPPQKEISYEIINRWAITNGGEGKKILIPRDYLNETDMTALCGKLKENTKNDRNVTIYIFTDRKATAIHESGLLPDELNKTDFDIYNKNFVGLYSKNGNTAFNGCEIYFDGEMVTKFI